MARSIDYSLGPAVFPRGWFVIAQSQELGARPVPLKFWGRDLALYRGESGRVVLLDAYCGHMGTHLAASDSAVLAASGRQIEGDSIRCPYHGWRFNAEGQCDDIPYLEGRCPRSAAIRSYPVTESMGCIMAWFDEQQAAPEYEAPSLDEWNSEEWVNWELDCCGEMAVHPQEILDNMADVRHLGPTHGAHCEFYENEFDGHVYIQRQGGFHEDYQAFLETVTWYTGPGILLSRQSFGESHTYQFIANTPVEDGLTRIWHGLLFYGGQQAGSASVLAEARRTQKQALEALAADFSIWANKRPALNVMQVKTDGPFKKGRDWYRQFFVARETAAAICQEIDGVHWVPGLPEPYEGFPSFDATGVAARRVARTRCS